LQKLSRSAQAPRCTTVKRPRKNSGLVVAQIQWQRTLAKRNIGQLTALVKTRLKRMQCRPGLLDGFLASTGLDLAPFCAPRN
jgi:hypothetical protein